MVQSGIGLTCNPRRSSWDELTDVRVGGVPAEQEVGAEVGVRHLPIE